MTKEEIIEIYIEVSNKLCNGTEWCWVGVGEPLQLFAKLVAEKAIKEALTQEQEPVAWMNDSTPSGIFARHIDGARNFGCTIPLYTTPPQRTWVGLTDEEINKLWAESHEDGIAMQQGFTTQQHYFAHLILRKVQEK